MKKICAVFALFFTLIFSVMSLYSAPAQTPKAAGKQPAEAQQAAQTQPVAQQQPQAAKPKTVIAKSYSFAEELIEIPLKPFEAQKIADEELMNMNPQLLKLYENAVNAEKQPNNFKEPASVIKAWAEIAKIKQQNPFLQAATERLTEWKNCVDLFNRHKNSLDKIKMLLSNTLLSDGQKTNLVIQHLSEFGVNFGTRETAEMVEKTEIPKNASFQEKMKETKRIRCEKNSGKDCFDCGSSAPSEQEKTAFFQKSCDLKFQPGCDEINIIKAAQEAEKAKIAAEEKRKAEEFATRKFDLQEKPLNIIAPFALGAVNEQDMLTTDPKLLSDVEAVVNSEKQPEIIKTPGAMIVAWEKITKVTENNPFLPIATKRLAEWRVCLEKMDKYEKQIAEMKKSVGDNALPIKYRTAYVLNFLKEYGVSFGTVEVLKAALYSNEITYNTDVVAKIKEIRKERCELKSGIDCQTYGARNAADDAEKALYFKKACDLGQKAACTGDVQEAETATPAPAKVAEQPKEPEKPKELTEEEKYKKELGEAGKKKRIAIATSTLAAGVVVGILGGVSLYGMNKAKKDRDKYFDSYKQSTEYDEMVHFRKKTQDADKKRKTYMGLGIAGIGVGIALIATGITFYSIEFEGEKEVKKKYNVSFGASPFDGTLQFALRW